jgi:hypothetical protein
MNDFGVFSVSTANRQCFVRMVEGSVLIYRDHYYLVLDQPPQADRIIDLNNPDGLRRLILQGLFGEDLK